MDDEPCCGAHHSCDRDYSGSNDALVFMYAVIPYHVVARLKSRVL